MTKKANVDKDDLIKSLIEIGIPEDEANDMVKSDEKEEEEEEKEEEEEEIKKKSEKKKKKVQSDVDIEKSMELIVEDKFNELQKSLDAIGELKTEVNLLKSQLDKIGNETPQPKFQGITNDVILEKAVDGGITSKGETHLSEKTHKEQIGNLLVELHSESTGELQKSVEMDLSNYIAGAGELGSVSKRLLKEKKNIIVH